MAHFKTTIETDLHHECDGVEGDHDHDEVIEDSRHDQSPHAVLQRVLVTRHVPADRLRIDREVDALFL